MNKIAIAAVALCGILLTGAISSGAATAGPTGMQASAGQSQSLVQQTQYYHRGWRRGGWGYRRGWRRGGYGLPPELYMAVVDAYARGVSAQPDGAGAARTSVAACGAAPAKTYRHI